MPDFLKVEIKVIYSTISGTGGGRRGRGYAMKGIVNKPLIDAVVSIVAHFLYLVL